ncbi:reverse transcriptase/maturase family protein [Bacillus pseudomycoides]|uniref:reverse transcriptase/maturase family protein n=1 Tax=Bacillus pseudomycoides TaxID=64104 RepID=UPI000BEF612B|nr:reverse transcriptase/maturase family protein [Bacillus pseudomycoides]PEK62677.1 group II intron reverse transcriptase/maturase [Bacillus pseudomycoides]PFY52391.1 group II intron reverse transcriptase/maturase [Bacillus pseudomycoides]
MRNPQVVLDNLTGKSNDENYKYQRVYRNLYNPEFYLMAYDEIYSDPGNMTKGSDGKTIDGMSMKRISNIIDSLKGERYQPTPVRRTYIGKKRGNGKRPLGIPSFDDKLLQTVVKYILESIYERSFSDRSHGYRPNKSCHTAIKKIADTFNGIKWFVEGDIKGFFDNIDHSILINLLRKRIMDEKFLRLIWKFLKAGYVEDWKYHNSYSGTPQGGIISPILSNIYLNELDKFIEEFQHKFNKGKNKAENPEYRKLHQKSMRLKKKLKDKAAKGTLEESEREEMIGHIQEANNKKMKLPSKDPMDQNYKRLKYVRYADDFLIGIIGSKEDAVMIKKELTEFISHKLKLELSQEKTLITNSRKFARFLGYDIAISRNQQPKPTSRPTEQQKKVLSRSHSGRVSIYMPKEAWVSKLIEHKAIKIDGCKWRPMHRRVLVNNDDLEILTRYNAEIRGMYNYFRLAMNVSGLNKFKYFMEYSLYKTFANKYKTSISKVKNKYCINGVFAVRYKTKKDNKTRYFYDDGFKRNHSIKADHTNTDIPINKFDFGRTSLISRLEAERCEWCHVENVELEIHHVRKLKDLKGKKLWEKAMIARNRKTMALCAQGCGNDCHRKLHAGLLD